MGGIPEFYRVQRGLDIYAGEETVAAIERMYSFMDYRIHLIEAFKPFKLFGMEITPVPVDHPPLKQVFGMVVRVDGCKLVITGDTSNRLSKRTIEEMYRPDVLIADAIHPTYHFRKHMNAKEALELSKVLDAEHTFFVHLSHLYPPHEVAIKQYPLAYDGMQVILKDEKVEVLGERVQANLSDFLSSDEGDRGRRVGEL